MTEPYDDFGRDLLRAGKTAEAPEERMRARAMETVTKMALVAGGTTAAAATTAKAGALATALKGLLSIKGLLVVAAASAAVCGSVYAYERLGHVTPAAPPIPPNATAIATATAMPTTPVLIATTATTEDSVSASPPPTPTTMTAPTAPTAPTARASGSTSTSAKTGTSSLSEELGLVDDARKALAAGDPTTALRSVAEHDRRFPAGALATERDVVRIDALVAAGRRDEANARARTFLARHPHAAQAERIAKLVGANP